MYCARPALAAIFIHKLIELSFRGYLQKAIDDRPTHDICSCALTKKKRIDTVTTTAAAAAAQFGDGGGGIHCTLHPALHLRAGAGHPPRAAAAAPTP